MCWTIHRRVELIEIITLGTHYYIRNPFITRKVVLFSPYISFNKLLGHWFREDHRYIILFSILNTCIIFYSVYSFEPLEQACLLLCVTNTHRSHAPSGYRPTFKTDMMWWIVLLKHTERSMVTSVLAILRSDSEICDDQDKLQPFRQLRAVKSVLHFSLWWCFISKEHLCVVIMNIEQCQNLIMIIIN